MTLCTKFERKRAIRVGVIALFDLMTLNMALRVALGMGYVSPSLTFDNLSVPEL